MPIDLDLDLYKTVAKLRERRRNRQLAPKYDWYGEGCPCGVPPGACKEHHRARPLESRRDAITGKTSLFGQRPPPGDWKVWLFSGGRGAGKTRTGAEWVRWHVENGKARRIALVSETVKDVRGVMIEGPGGLIDVSPPWCRPEYHPSRAEVVWPTGAIATIFSAEQPDQLRGFQHDLGWLDELAKWSRAQQETWDNFELGLRLGDDPRAVVTTTPRPTPTFKALLEDRQTVVTRGTSFDNAPHLAPSFLGRITDRYVGTRLGRQEVEAELLEDVPGACWDTAILERSRRQRVPEGVRLARLVVGVDPAAGSADPESGAEVGIVVAAKGSDGHGYVLADHSLKGSVGDWTRRAVEAYHEFRADRIVAEVNNGGDMVVAAIHGADRRVPVKKLWASRGKVTRAQPVALLFEKDHAHVVGTLPALEHQLCNWVPGMDSPDRLDACVWALTELMLGGHGEPSVQDDPFGGTRW